MTTTVSTKFQVVIPREVRTFLQVKPGMQYLVSPGANGVIQLTPMSKTKSVKELKGFLKGKLTPFKREPDRKL